MRVALVAVALSLVAACSTTARDGGATFTGFSAGLTGAAAKP